MWILLRLVAAAIVGVLKFRVRRSFGGEAKLSGTTRWLLSQGKHKGRVVSTRFGVRFEHPVFFRLSRETALDRFFKAIGFTREIQTGDAEFDDEIYVSCDHPALAPVLQADLDLRLAIRSLFRKGVKLIHADGERLWAQRSGDTLPDEADLTALVRVRDALKSVPDEHLQMLHDGFFWRALLVEAVAWSVAFYGLPAAIEIATRSHPQYFDWMPVIRTGALLSIVVFAALFGLSWALLRGSSRAHRVLTESAILLLIGVPLSSIQAVSDLNVALDGSAPAVLHPVVHDTYKRTSIRRGRQRTQYYVQLALKPEQVDRLPPEIRVSAGIHAAARRGSALAITLREGALGIPWVQDIRASR